MKENPHAREVTHDLQRKGKETTLINIHFCSFSLFCTCHSLFRFFSDIQFPPLTTLTCAILFQCKPQNSSLISSANFLPLLLIVPFHL